MNTIEEQLKKEAIDFRQWCNSNEWKPEYLTLENISSEALYGFFKIEQTKQNNDEQGRSLLVLL